MFFKSKKHQIKELEYSMELEKEKLSKDWIKLRYQMYSIFNIYIFLQLIGPIP